MVDASLLDAVSQSSEIELLRTVADGLGVQWGHDELGWWAFVPNNPTSQFVEQPPAAEHVDHRYALFRLDDNGVRFLIDYFGTREEAEQKAAQLAIGGHKQHYFVEAAT